MSCRNAPATLQSQKHCRLEQCDPSKIDDVVDGARERTNCASGPFCKYTTFKSLQGKLISQNKHEVDAVDC